MKYKTKKQVEKEVQALIDEFDLSKKLSLERVQKWIFESHGEHVAEIMNEFFMKCYKHFPELEDMEEINRIFDVLQNAWNYFPHKSLGGKSPYQMVKQFEKTHPQLQKKSHETQMPKVIVGGKEMTWEEHQDMIKEMEMVQRPFKAWIDDVVLPKYRIFLKQTVKQKKKREGDLHVAEIFFHRVLHVGFVRFDLIRPEFIQTEFPMWWQSHVFDSRLTPTQVQTSLKRLFSFIELVADMPVRDFGF